MKPVAKSDANKVPLVIIDPELNKLKGIVLFPEKVEKARQAVNRLGLPAKTTTILNNSTD